MPDKKDAFKNQVEKKSKTRAVPKPSRITDLDTAHGFYNNIIDASESQTLDLERLNSFTNISRSRNEVYNLLDMMGTDPVISAALDIYTSDVCEPSDNGHIMWCESADSKIAAEVNHLLDSVNVDKYAYGWVYSLIKYGDLYLRLYRNSDYNDEPTEKEKEDARKLTEAYNVLDYNNLTEDLILKAYSRVDHYAEYLEAVRNPAEMFNIYRMGKSYGYIRTHLPLEIRKNPDDYMTPYEMNSLNNMYQFNRDDVDIFEATEFVHACLNESVKREDEEVSISINTGNEDEEQARTKVYTVKRGQSILYNAFKIWRELTLLENSVLLNRVTKSSIIRTVSVEVGDMEKSDVQMLLQRVKQSIEQKSAINRGVSYQSYTSPGPVENTIYIPMHEGIGAITTGEIGGNVEVGDLGDLKYWKKKLYAALGVPGQFLNDTDDSTGFNGGTSLSLISSRYAKSVKRIQNTFIQAITDAINMMLLDKGLTDYINRFVLKMQAPTTQEEKDRKDSETTSLSNVSTVMGLLDQIEDPTKKLEILKSQLSSSITDTTVIDTIQEEIDRLSTGAPTAPEAAAEENGEEGDFDFGGGGAPSGGGSSGGFDFGGGEESGGEEESGSEPLDLGGEEGGEAGGEELPTPEETGAPEEDFTSGKGGEVPNETDNLYSWEDMDKSFVDYPAR